MTSYMWGQLAPGEYELPLPAVIVSSWVLDVRLRRPSRSGFHQIGTRPRAWRSLSPAAGVYADYADDAMMWVYRTDQPEHETLHRDYTGVDDYARADAAEWCIGSPVRPADPAGFADAVHTAGEVALAIGDLTVYWDAHTQGLRPPFEQLFPRGSYAAVVPLLRHVYVDGVGTRPRRPGDRPV